VAKGDWVRFKTKGKGKGEIPGGGNERNEGRRGRGLTSRLRRKVTKKKKKKGVEKGKKTRGQVKVKFPYEGRALKHRGKAPM